MMIKISERIHPFSHKPGVKIPIPQSQYFVQVYPALLKFYLGMTLEKEMTLDIQGPVKEFTTQLDLVKGVIHVWGHATSGFFRYHIFAGERGPELSYEKSCRVQLPELEKLSLGSHKSQDWSGIVKRGDLKEIFPVWYLLGQLVPETHKDFSEGTLSLLKECTVYEDFHRLFLAGFEGIMSPRLEDTDYQGFLLPPVTRVSLSPLPLLSQGWRMIRNLFFREAPQELIILPSLPKEFHCGRLIGIKTRDGDQVHLEWTKKALRRLEIRSKEDKEIHLNLPKEFKSWRLKTHKNDRGERQPVGTILKLEKEKPYIIDNLRK